MAMQILSGVHNRTTRSYTYTVWLDDSKFEADGKTADPDWVRSWSWGSHPLLDAKGTPLETQAQHDAGIVSALKLHATAALTEKLVAVADVQTPTAAPVVGF